MGLHSFDVVLSALSQNLEDFTDCLTDKKIIGNLINLKLNSNPEMKIKVDDYILNEWDLFLEKREVIDLDLTLLHQNYCNVADIVMYNVVDNELDIANGMDNVL